MSVYSSVKEPGDSAALLKELQRPGHAEPTTVQRTQLIETLLSFLERDDTSDSYSTIASLKLLGRTPVGSEGIVRGLPILLKHSGLARASTEDHEALNDGEREALRCICNALLLHPSARDSFPSTFDEDPRWTKGLVNLLSVHGTGFLAGRLLFLLSSKYGQHINHLVDECDTVKQLQQTFTDAVKLLQSDPAPLTAGPPPTLADTLKEQLKAAYNLMLFYARLHPAASADSRASHAGLFGTSSPDAGELTLEASKPFRSLFQPILQLAVLLPAGDDPRDPSALLRSTFHALLVFPVTMEELDGFEHSWLQDVDGHIQTISGDQPALPPLADRLYQLFEASSESLLPSDTLPKNSRQSRPPADVDELVPRGTGESTRIDDILAPMILLLRKLSLLSTSGDALHARILPRNFDRSIPPERHRDATGLLVRLMSSIMLPNSAFAAGELLYSLCKNSPEELSKAIGYGNASGFLQNRGELIAPPAASSEDDEDEQTERPTSADRPDLPDLNKKCTTFPTKQRQTNRVEKRAINPITGAYEKPTKSDEPVMSDEEKEREAERLFVLFDRMKKTGVIDIDNPVVKAKQKGDLEQSAEEAEAERRAAEQKEAQEEQEALEELKRYKERKAQNRAA